MHLHSEDTTNDTPPHHINRQPIPPPNIKNWIRTPGWISRPWEHSPTTSCHPDEGHNANGTDPVRLLRHFNTLYMFHPKLKFTLNKSNQEIPSLDIKVIIFNNSFKLWYTIKPTVRKVYLNFFSNHQTHTKKSIPFSQFLRLKWIVSEPTDLETQVLRMTDAFKLRNYPDPVLNGAIQKLNKGPSARVLFFTREGMWHISHSEYRRYSVGGAICHTLGKTTIFKVALRWFEGTLFLFVGLCGWREWSLSCCMTLIGETKRNRNGYFFSFCQKPL